MKSITIYSTPTCVYCRAAKKFFTEQQLSYIEKDVASDIEARKEMIEKSEQLGVPVIDIDGTIVVGFHEAKLRELIGV